MTILGAGGAMRKVREHDMDKRQREREAAWAACVGDCAQGRRVCPKPDECTIEPGWVTRLVRWIGRLT
jgi:hypothetical protein